MDGSKFVWVLLVPTQVLVVLSRLDANDSKVRMGVTERMITTKKKKENKKTKL